MELNLETGMVFVCGGDAEVRKVWCLLHKLADYLAKDGFRVVSVLLFIHFAIGFKSIDLYNCLSTANYTLLKLVLYEETD